jgi:hypothetical protein
MKRIDGLKNIYPVDFYDKCMMCGQRTRYNPLSSPGSFEKISVFVHLVFIQGIDKTISLVKAPIATKVNSEFYVDFVLRPLLT